MSGDKIIESGQRVIKLSKAAGASDDAARRAKLAAFLARKAPRDTAKVVARGSGTPAATVYKWLAGEAFPNGYAMIRLWRLFGVEFLVEVCDEAPARLATLLDRAERRRTLLAALADLDRMPG